MGFSQGPDYLKLPRAEQMWVVQDLLPVSGFLSMYGNPKAGKSFLALQMASCISDPARNEMLGFQIHTHGSVCYLQVDTPRSIWADRLEKIATEGWNYNDVWFTDPEIAPYPFELLLDGGQWLKSALDEVKPLVVVVDTLRDIHGGNENESHVMRNVIVKLRQLCAPAAVILLSHARKPIPDATDDLMNDNRGSTAVAGAVDGVMRVGKTQIHYGGRACGEHKLSCKRTPQYMWALNEDEHKRKATALLHQQTGEKVSISALAGQLADETGLSKEAARSLLRRLGSP